ncbi:MAG: hypothetical protein OXL96_12545 [Candidatus Poribacteria bacterium]|nr:hypothetical protein [Candidatus Poribacteria bacterium]
MFRSFLLIFSLCGLTAVSVVLEYKASAETFACPPTRVCLPKAPPPCETLPCVPSGQPPVCEMPVCQVPHPLPKRTGVLRSLHRVSQQVFPNPSSIVFPCILSTTADIMRAMSR